MGKKYVAVYSVDQATHRCPLCGAPIHWACNGKTGYAYCANSPNATRMWKRGEGHMLTMCEWEGKAIRRPNGKVEIYYYP